MRGGFMIVILDTEQGRVKEIPQITDAHKSMTEITSDVTDLLAVAIVGQAMKTYKTKAAMELYITAVASTAKRFMNEMEKKDDRTEEPN